MSLSTLKPVAFLLPQAAGANGSRSNVSKVRVVNTPGIPSLQVRKKEEPFKQENFKTVSRRETIYLAAGSIGFLSLLLPAPAEARSRNSTMRQKIMEKLEKLRQKAELSKPKDEGEEMKRKVKDEAGKPKPKSETEEKKHKPEPSLANILNGKAMETTLP